MGKNVKKVNTKDNNPRIMNLWGNVQNYVTNIDYRKVTNQIGKSISNAAMSVNQAAQTAYKNMYVLKNAEGEFISETGEDYSGYSNSCSQKPQFLEIFSTTKKSDASKQEPVGPQQISEAGRVYNCVVYLIHCPEHDNLAVMKGTDSIIFLPYHPLSPRRTWRDSAMLGSFTILTNNSSREILRMKQRPPYEHAEMVDIFRFPIDPNYYTRCLFHIRLQSSKSTGAVAPPAFCKAASKINFDLPAGRLQSTFDGGNRPTTFRCCEPRGALIWLPIKEICQGQVSEGKVWGPELVIFARNMQAFCNEPIFTEAKRNGDLRRTAVTPDEIQRRKYEDAVVKSSGITEKDIERLYWDYMNHCFPSFFMTIWSFKAYMISYGFSDRESRLVQLFGAFNINRNGYINFLEFLWGLTCMEPGSAHSDFRLSFVFRYYDTRNNGALSERDFTKLLTDNYPKDNPESIKQRCQEYLRPHRKEIKLRGGIPWNTFKFIINSSKIRGTSMLCRSRKAIFNFITQTVANRQMEYKRSKLKVSKIANMIVKSRREKCRNCRNKKYKLVGYSVSCRIRSLSVLNPVNLEGLSRANRGDSQSLSHIVNNIEPLLDDKNPARRFLMAIHAFAPNKGDIHNPNGLLTEDPRRFYADFKDLCEKVQDLIKDQPKCPAVIGPTVVVGDIHGNLDDLLTIEKSIWRLFSLSSTRFVFLGDYVDRGKWSIECAVYILCLKVIMPKKVTLLRGNHEVRNIQEKYSFSRECIDKYTDNQGNMVWDLLNETFDKFAISATIDQSFYCAHGGIPRTITNIEQINQLPHDIQSPEHSFPEVWEIMWSDPINDQQFFEMCQFFQIDPKEGFVRNTKRGAAFFFAEVGAFKFLRDNGLTHIIRAHEVPQHGFTFHFTDQRCITVFSCSHYCGNQNEVAVVLINKHESKIRVCRIDTSHNNPATDSN